MCIWPTARAVSTNRIIPSFKCFEKFKFLNTDKKKINKINKFNMQKRPARFTI